MLILPKRFAQQAPRPRAKGRLANFPARNDSHSGFTAGSINPVQEKATHRQTTALGTRPQEVPSASDASLARKSQRMGRRAHKNYVPTGVRRLRPTRRRLLKMARPLFVELRLRKPC